MNQAMSPTLPQPQEMYDALARRDTTYEGVFIVGVRTTGVFCRPGCPARLPNFENVEFFAGARDAAMAGYRPCKRCRPLELAGTPPGWVSEALALVESDPSRRWTDEDLRAAGIDPVTARRWFKKHHGMTFQAYARGRRLASALGRIRGGDDSTGAAFDAGFESLSGFREAFARLFGFPPGTDGGATPLTINRLPTPLGPMLAAATDAHLCLLEFVDRRMLETQLRRLQQRVDGVYVPGNSGILEQTARELDEYFDGGRQQFDVPIDTPGTDFQQSVWRALGTIPYGETWSYQELAKAVGRPTATRAVGTANGDNRIALIVPCHRVIRADGDLGGYGGQLWRKRALLNLEREQRS